MYKLLVLDMDGTLLNSTKQISIKNKEAIELAKRKGVKVVLCTGRSIEGIQNYLEELKLVKEDEYSITCTGAYIVNNTNTKIVECNYLSIEDVKKINSICDKLGVMLTVFTEKKLLVPRQGLFCYIDALTNNIDMELCSFNEFQYKTRITKATIINEDKSVENDILTYFPGINTKNIIIEEKEGFNKELFVDINNLPKELLDNYTVVNTSPFTIEVLNKNSNKGEGVKALARELGISKEEIICIGDSGNDIHMIEYAGLGVAMANAIESVKGKAEYVTLSNDENGVAHVIEKFILERKC